MSKYFALLILSLFSISLSAQNSATGKSTNNKDVYGSYEKKQIDKLLNLYSETFDSGFQYISGREFVPYYFRSKSTPILYGTKKHKSSLLLDGRKFEGENLEYDTFTDDVIFIDSSRTFIYYPLKIILNKDKVNGFCFYYRHDTLNFRYFKHESDSLFNLPSGFYELVYNGKSKYIIRHRSTSYENNGVKEYIYNTDGFLNTGSGFIKTGTKKQFRKQFGVKYPEVRRYLRGSGIRLQDADKEQIIAVLKYYDSIKDIPVTD